MTRRRLLLDLSLTTAVALAAGPAAVVHAAPSPTGISITPADGQAALTLAARPGETVRGALRVRNDSAQPRTVRLSPADLTTASTGGSMYGAGRPRGNGRWITLAARDVRLAPRTSRVVRFTARLPRGLRGGAHYAGIVAVDRAGPPPARDVHAGTGRQTVSITQVLRYALPVKFRLPGALRPRLRATKATATTDAGGATVTVGLASVGTALIQSAVVDVDVLRGGKRVLRHRAQLGQVLPDSRFAYPIALPRVPSDGTYRIVGTVRPAGAAPVRIDQAASFDSQQRSELRQQAGAQDVPGTAGPGALVWIALAAVSAVALGLGLALLRTRRRVIAPAS